MELSLDGLAEFHDTFRVAPGSFARAMETYDALVELQARDPRLRIHAISTATDVNIVRDPPADHLSFRSLPPHGSSQSGAHHGAIERTRRLRAPAVGDYQQLYDYVRRLWHPREQGRYGAIVEPMLQWAKTETVARKTQVVPCRPACSARSCTRTAT